MVVSGMKRQVNASKHLVYWLREPSGNQRNSNKCLKPAEALFLIHPPTVEYEGAFSHTDFGIDPVEASATGD